MNPLPNDSNSIPAASIAGMIDHTILKPDTTESAVKKICEEAIKYQFASVCISPSYVPVAAEVLSGSPVKVCTVVGFPSGAHATAIKVAETNLAIEQGAAEIDMVINIGAMKSGNYDLVYDDILLVCQACHTKNALLKVIIETALLTDDEKQMACELAKKAKADFVKTSTGFASGGATAEDIALMRKTVGEKMGVKASGGVRTYEDAVKMIKAGATRIGASASIKIIRAA